MKKFKNLEDLWQYIKKEVPSGVNVTTIEKSSQQKLFYVTVPKTLVTNGKKADYEMTFMETGGDIEVFIEPTNDSFSILDFDDLKEIMPISLKESLTESFTIDNKYPSMKVMGYYGDDKAAHTFIDKHMPISGFNYYIVWGKDKQFAAAKALMKKSKEIAKGNFCSGVYYFVAYESPKGLRFIWVKDILGNEYFMFPEQNINENYLTEASVYVETSSDPAWDNVIQFEYHNGRANLQKELEDAFGKGRVKFQLIALPHHEFELYVKKDKTPQWIEFLKGGLSESTINESAYDDWRKFLAKQKCINDSDKQYVLVYPNKKKEKLYPELYQTSANKLVTNEGSGGYIVKREGSTLKAIGYVGISISKYELDTFTEKFGKDKVGNCKNEAEVNSFLTSIKESYMNESEAQDRYREFFENKLRQYNVSSPSELSQDQKSKFFQEVKSEWAEEKKKQGINEAFTARELSKDMLDDFTSPERKFIEENIPGIKSYFQVYRGKSLGAAEALAKKSTTIAKTSIAGFNYVAYESPKGLRFIGMSDGFGGESYIFGEKKINENYLSEAEVMKATGKLYFTEETAGQMSGDELQNALKNLSDTMSQLSADPTEDSVKAYKECEDSYQCLKAELLKRGLETVN